MIKLENLTKSYRIRGGRHYVFREVNAVLPEGANIGIIGPNGAGKSTLLSILGRVDHPDSGRVISDKSFSWPMGLKGGFLNHLSGRENCRMVCNLYGLPHDVIKKKMALIKELSGIGKYFDEPVRNYSSGMGSRLGFALSMAFDFDYFLIDEVTAVGDAHFSMSAKLALEEKAKRSRVIMVSHNMGDIKKFCDVGVLIKNGQITVFENLDDAIRAYLPQTKEAGPLSKEEQKALAQEIGIKKVELPETVSKFVPEIRTRLGLVEQVLKTPGFTVSRKESEFYFDLAKVYRKLGDKLRAREFARRASYYDPFNIKILLTVAEFAAEVGDLPEEKEALDAAEKLDPKNFDMLDARIQFFMRTGKFQEALEASDVIIRVKPKLAAVWADRARIFLYLGMPEEALQAQTKAIKLAPKNRKLYQQIAVVLAVQGDFEASARARQKAAAIAKKKGRRVKLPAYKDILKSVQKLGNFLSV
ncbi:MAG: ATP-binding cassette domain-containing protein [Opitutus sp.]|nr:ATP-binding cassette domain-containing protein [Opitutus sp.]